MIDWRRLTAAEASRRYVRERARRENPPIPPQPGDVIVDASSSGEAEDDYTQLVQLHTEIAGVALEMLIVRHSWPGNYHCGLCGHSATYHGIPGGDALTGQQLAAIIAASRCPCQLDCDCRGFDEPKAHDANDEQVSARLGLTQRLVARIRAATTSLVEERILAVRMRGIE